MFRSLSGSVRVLLASAVLFAGVTPDGGLALADQGAPASQEARIAELERRVKELEELLRKALEGRSSEEVEELKRRIDLLSKELEKEKLGEAAAPRVLESRYGLGPAASKVYGVDRGVSFGGYGEGLYQDFEAENDAGDRTGRDSVADALRAVLYFGYKFNDTIVFNSEIEFEHATTGSGDEELGEVSVEFANVDFLLSEPGNVRAGLVLLPVGFINELHEPPTFLGARRPDVENRIIPTTWREMGVGGFGDAGPFSYRGYVVAGLNAAEFSAGSGLRDGRQSGSESLARDLGLTARADFHGVAGLLVGGSFYQGESGQGAETAAGDVIEGQVTLYDAHAEYNIKGFQFRGLWAAVDVEDAEEINIFLKGIDPADPNTTPAQLASGVGSRMTGWYVQAGYDLLTWRGDRTNQSVIPFVRWERYDTQDRVPEGFTSTGVNDVTLLTYGVNWKPILNMAIKLDFQDYEREDGSGNDQVNAAIGYLF